jgi:hypothetical protein
MGFTLSNHIEAREIPREEYITHADVSLGDAVADPWIGRGKRKGIPYPEASHCHLDEPLIKNLGGMVLSSVDDGNAGTSGHQTVDDLIPCGFNSYGSENLHHKGKDQGNGFNLMDDRIIKGWIVHLHIFPLGYPW